MLPVENHCYRKKRILRIVSYIFIAFQFKKASACFNSVGKKEKEKMKKIRREKEGGRQGGRAGCKQHTEMEKGQVPVKEGVIPGVLLGSPTSASTSACPASTSKPKCSDLNSADFPLNMPLLSSSSVCY